jgi:hypothetical protein
VNPAQDQIEPFTESWTDHFMGVACGRNAD